MGMDKVMIEPYLYLLMRDDLNSMNGGKAVAHGAHAANQFMFEMERRMDADHEKGSALCDEVHAYKAWADSAKGFGTTIALSMSLKELQTVVMVANSIGCMAAETVDPTYPYVLHKEYAGLITHPEAYPPSPIGGGKMLCLREEITAGFVFGDKSALKPVLGNFPLMP